MNGVAEDLDNILRLISLAALRWFD